MIYVSRSGIYSSQQYDGLKKTWWEIGIRQHWKIGDLLPSYEDQ
jgi:hypothetical protein